MSRLIDADAFKEYICNAYEQVKHMYPDGGEWARQITEDFCKDIDEQPTVETETEWIPCDERLPKYGQLVLTYNLKDDEYEVNHIIDEEDGEWFTHGVSAWMLLPPAYKGEEE